MKLKFVNKKLVDVFLDKEQQHTGWEPSCWLRLQNHNGTWVQVQGIKIPAWKFKMILSEIEKETT